MERIIHLLIIAFLLLSVSGNAEEKLQLKLQEGQTICFCYSSSSSTNEPPLNFIQISEQKTHIKISVLKQITESQFTLEVTSTRSLYDQFGTWKPAVHFDTMFPSGSGQTEYVKFPIVINNILGDFKIKMALDLDKNELVLQDQAHLKAKIEQSLLQRNTPVIEFGKTNQLVNQTIEGIRKITANYLLRFNNASFETKDSAQLSNKDYLVRRSGNSLKLVMNKTLKKNGKIEEQIHDAVVDQTNGLIIESVLNSFYPPYKKENGQMVAAKRQIQTYQLIQNSESLAVTTTISGFVEHPEDRYILIQVLEKPAGMEFKTYSAPLDSSNHFSLTIPQSRAGFIFLSGHYPDNLLLNSSSKAIYAEPGDHIIVDLMGRGKDVSIKHKGDRITENSVLITCNPQLSMQHGNTQLGYFLPLIRTGPPHTFQRITDCLKYIKADQQLEISKTPDLSLRFKDYLSNEVVMAKLAMACDMLGSLPPRNKEELTAEFKQAYADLKLFTDTVQICRHYNEYGIFSRDAVARYAVYLFQENRRYNTPLSPDHIYSSNIMFYFPWLQKTYSNYLDMILSGSSLVREKARSLLESLKYSNHLFVVDRENWYAERIEFSDELIKSSRDTLLNEFVKEKLKYAREFLDGTVFQHKIFVNPMGDTLSINDFLGKKPVVLFVSGNWGASRYYFDDLSEKHPEGTFIHLVSGGNYESWKDYLKRADPKAFQLFLPNDQYSLQELFSNMGISNRVIVFDINGNVCEREANLDYIKTSLEKAQNPPKEEKELDKAILYRIIWFMSGLLLIILTVFLSFKYRLRRRMKKQEQEKRLRELELTAIRSQMNPHFLFNSLNSVQNLIRQNRATEANLYLSDFAGIIRKVMRNSEKEEISLAEELELVDQYLRVEKLRFDFEYAIQVEEQVDAPHLMIPPLLIQPFAENALLHGLQHKPADRRLQITIGKEGPQIKILVEDNGIGREAAEAQETTMNGKGIKMSTERLKILEERDGGGYSIRITDLTAAGKTGTRVEISLPDEE
jgi:hypothetical protein